MDGKRNIIRNRMSRMSSTLRSTTEWRERKRERERERERETGRNLEGYYVQHVHTINLFIRWQEKKSSNLTSK